MSDLVGLIDCNNFFVSCERLFRPDLNGKPVLVLSSNDGCVVARSQEVKDKGIPMGVPIFQVKDIIKDIKAISFSSHFALYRDISRRVFEVVRREMNIVEQYSIDEAFFTLSATSRRELLQEVTYLKDKIEREVGIPVSIGVAETKTLAKYASRVAKRTNGIYLLEESERQTVMAPVLLKELWGVGKQLSVEYQRHGITKVGELLAVDRFMVDKLFGVTGVRLWQELQGIPSSILLSNKKMPHSILHSQSFKTTTTDISVLKDAVSYHVREAGVDLREQELKTKVLQVTLGTSRHGSYFLHGGSREYLFKAPTADMFELAEAALRLVDELFVPGVPYKKAGVLLYDFVPETVDQPALFVSQKEETTKALTPLIDNLNKRLQKGSRLVLGAYFKNQEWQTSQSKKSPAYTTSWKDIVVVKA